MKYIRNVLIVAIATVALAMAYAATPSAFIHEGYEGKQCSPTEPNCNPPVPGLKL